ncbi:hypothetical protein FM036_23735 [Nostoc sp. HG1]|nr:hypothetical protein [Nostoc sp. HG1]
MIKYHSNHFGMASLAHNKKKAIQERRDRVMLISWQHKDTQGLPAVATTIVMHSSYVGGV